MMTHHLASLIDQRGGFDSSISSDRPSRPKRSDSRLWPAIAARVGIKIEANPTVFFRRRGDLLSQGDAGCFIWLRLLA